VPAPDPIAAADLAGQKARAAQPRQRKIISKG